LGIAADFVLIVLSGLVGAMAARALGLPLLVGYVAAGVVVGPNTAGPTVSQIQDIELLAEIGVALLLFSLGLEISFRDLGPVKKVALLGGTIEVLFVMGATAMGAQAGLGVSWGEGAWLGAMAALSSTMVVLKTLSATGMTATLASRVMVGMLVLQDLAVIPLLVILPKLGAIESAGGELVKAVGIAAGMLVGVYVVGTRVFPLLLKRVIALGSRELFLVTVVAVGIGAGYAMHAAGLSFALGAFLAGIILSESEFSHQALSDIVPLRDIFGLLFFVTVGMLFDPAFVMANAGKITVVVGMILVGKALVIGLLARAFGYVNLAPWIVGLGLSQVGEFSFVLARAGLSQGALTKSSYDLALTATVVTMALSPMVAGLGPKLGRLWKARFGGGPVKADAELRATTKGGHVIVGGYGRSGTGAAEELVAEGAAVLVVESDYPRFGDVAEQGLEAIWGDVGRPEILMAAGVEKARALILTMPNEAVVRRAMEEARRMNGSLKVLVRAVDGPHAMQLSEMGADAVVQPEREGGVALARRALTS